VALSFGNGVAMWPAAVSENVGSSGVMAAAWRWRQLSVMAAKAMAKSISVWLMAGGESGVMKIIISMCMAGGVSAAASNQCNGNGVMWRNERKRGGNNRRSVAMALPAASKWQCENGEKQPAIFNGWQRLSQWLA